MDPAAAATVVSGPQLHLAPVTPALASNNVPSSRAAELPAGLAAEVTYLQRRYGSGFRVLDPAAGVSGQSDVAPASERDVTPALCFALDLFADGPLLGGGAVSAAARLGEQRLPQARLCEARGGRVVAPVT